MHKLKDMIKEVWRKMRYARLSECQQIYLALLLIWIVVGTLTLYSPENPTKLSYACILVSLLIAFMSQIVGR